MKSIDKNLFKASTRFPKNVIIPFGGRSIILVGDLCKMPFVMDKPINISKGHAKELRISLTKIVTLDTVFQQHKEHDEQNCFQC